MILDYISLLKKKMRIEKENDNEVLENLKKECEKKKEQYFCYYFFCLF